MSRQESSLRRFVTTRLLLLPATLWMVATILFVLLRIVPGDPVDAILGPRASEAVREQMRADLGLTGSLWVQYLNYLGQLLRLDLGTSISSTGKPVREIIATFFPASAELAIAALLVALAISIPLGVLAATHPRSPVDTATRTASILTYAIPVFWVGMMVQLVFGVYLGWFPIGNRLPVSMAEPRAITGLYAIDAAVTGNWAALGEALHHLAMPAVTLGLVLAGVFVRTIRVHLTEVLRSPYIAAARAKGLREWRVVFVHAGRNALVPILTVMGLVVASLMGGALLTEVTFSWPGLASRLILAIGQRDYPVVQGLVVFFASIAIAVSLLLDILNAYIDPRIRY
ncbi:ABC transporter permease [Synechococcus sp. PCC 7336]|uniref:ABC transporter permease n=1 Tax=Synechococcus sp. PCC 7336 TaxID=195250 RepID=UPI0003449E21|nr:ABC transporter permease [Synechococcus sp. PCC 7336]